MSDSFVDKCLSGDASLAEVDDYIDAWHQNDTSQESELHEYLGLNWEEYSLWVKNPSILPFIVKNKRKSQNKNL